VGVTAVRYLHVLAMAFFVGGQLFLVAAVVPTLRGDADRERLRAVARRFGWGTLVAIAVLIATGIAMASRYDQWSDGKLHVKLALVATVAVLVVWHMRRPALHLLEGLIFVASLAIVWLGLSLAHGG
jgi:uncharacterized membrane protein